MPVMSRERILDTRTVSYQNIILEVSGSKIPLRLKRHLAPRTVRIILGMLPIEGSAHMSGNMTYLNVEVNSGLERGRTSFDAGDVTFLPGARCICFITGPYQTKKPMTPIGVMDGDVSALKSTNPGDAIRVYEF